MQARAMVRGAWALALAGVGVAAQAQGLNSAWIADSSGLSAVGPTATPAIIGTPNPINLATWSGPEADFALVSGATQTLRGLSAAAGNASGRYHMQSGGSFSWVTEVLPGSSGLVSGDAITVFFDVHVDGSFDTRLSPFAGTPAAYHANTLSYMNLRYGISDMDMPGYDPENEPGLQFHYGGQATIEAGDVSWSADKVLYQSFDSAASATLQDGSAWEWTGNASGATLQSNLPPVAQVAFSVDTGVLRFSFDTLVGHHLVLDGYFRTEAFGLNEGGLAWQSLVDFVNTADGELVSSVPGVEFAGITPGVTPVPEPATWALMFTGVALLLGRTRRVRGMGAGGFGG